jgi:putative membrane protein
MMWWSNGGWGLGTWLAMGLMMVIFWAAAISLVVWVVRAASTGQPALPRRREPGRAEQELAERYARGEIDEAQLTHARSILHADDTAD